jgi:DNA-binding MarR family transcriptional regulator
VGSHESAGADDAVAILDAIRKVVRFLRLADSDAQAITGLSAAQLFVLHQLVERQARSVAELAERTLADPSSVSTVVERLVRRGMVRRMRSRDDARRVELRVTPIGMRIMRCAPSAPQERIARRVQALPAAKRGELIRALAVLVETIGADELPARMFFEDEPARARRSRAAAALAGTESPAGLRTQRRGRRRIGGRRELEVPDGRDAGWSPPG